jgi:hypothetical protein
VVTLVIMDTFLQKMRAPTLKGVRKMILIEEAWKAIATPAMAEYLKYLFKTVRKFQGEAIVVTQEVKDILDNPVVKDTIITQSDCMILLDLRKFMGKFNEIQEVLALSEKQKALVLSINQDRRQNVRYNEVYIGLGTTVATVYGVEVSKEEYVTYTTEEAEKKVLFGKVESGMSMETAIQSYAQELREAG